MTATNLKAYFDSKGNAVLTPIVARAGGTLILDVPVVSDQAGYVYHVDASVGADTNDGLTWGTAFKTIQAAVTASETARLLQTNVDIRNTIYIMGDASSSSYSNVGPITSCPNYTNIIGIGANPRGNGVGIARISGIVANTPAMTGTSTGGEMRGCYFENIQFNANGTSGYVVSLIKCFRNTFVNCSFMQDNVAGSPLAAFLVTSLCGGNTFDSCLFGSDTQTFAYGFKMTGTKFNNNLFVNNVIDGSTAAVYIASTVAADDWTLWDNNKIGGFDGTCAIGVDDDNSRGYSMYTNNYVVATDCFDLDTRGTYRTVHNHIIQSGSAGIEASGS